MKNSITKPETVPFIETFGYVGNGDFETTYLQLRQKEGRVYPDAIVAKLPHIQPGDPHSAEWCKRNDSCKRLLKYIKKQGSISDILEVGCGNGWLSNQVGSICQARVVASDINLFELRQGQRVFGGNTNLSFVYSDIIHLAKSGLKFDLILFAASIQYFESITALMKYVNILLKEKGELHILDSRFYQRHEAPDAIGRTRLYYDNAGFPQMAKHYYHHTFEEMEMLKFTVMYSPGRVSDLFNRSASPFPWFYYRKK